MSRYGNQYSQIHIFGGHGVLTNLCDRVVRGKFLLVVWVLYLLKFVARNAIPARLFSKKPVVSECRRPVFLDD